MILLRVIHPFSAIFLVVLTNLVVHHAGAFRLNNLSKSQCRSKSIRPRATLLARQMADDSTTSGKKPLSSTDIIARARKSIGITDDEDAPPKLFDDDLLEYMKKCLIMLEKRVKEGPGSLSANEVSELATMMRTISDDMESSSGNNSVRTSNRKHHIDANVASSDPTVSGPTSAPSAATLTMKQEEEASITNTVTDTSNDEAPAYTGKGGMGLASGTTNTYIIPGMDEMTPEEYRAALQQSVIDRQSGRKENTGGMVGNRAAHDYLSKLGWGGASANLAGTKDAGTKDD